MSSGFTFPPPVSGSGDSWDEVAYASGERGGSFIFPPAQRVDQDEGYEVARQVAGEINRIRDTAVDAGEQVSNLGVLVQDYGDILERKVEPWAVPTISPLSQTINRRADPTFGLDGFLSPTGSPSIQSGWNEKNRLYMAFITPAINRAYEQLNFMVGAVTNPCRMDIAIYVVNPDRQIIRQLRQDNVGLSIGTGQALVTATFPRWVATQGSYIGIAFRQHGSGNARSLLGLPDAPRPLGNIVFPRRLGARSTAASLDLVQSINGETQLNFESDWFVPYAELSENVGVDYRIFDDPFGREGYLIRPWVTLTDQAPHAAGGTVGVIRNIFSGFPAGPRISMYDTPVSTAHNAAEVRMWDTSRIDSHTTWFAVRGTNDMCCGVGVFITPNSVTLRQWLVSDPHDIRGQSTVLRTVSHSLSQNDTFLAEFHDGELTLYINGVQRATAQVSGFSEPRFGFQGIGFEKTTSGDVYPPRIAHWTARDLPQEELEDDEGEES